jgi:hypothetical protein
MTDTITLETRTLSAGEVVFSLDFVTKLVKKIHKDNPAYTIEQIGEALEVVFSQKLETMEKRLKTIEKIRAQYDALKSAEPVVASVIDMLDKAVTYKFVPASAQVQQAKPVARKPTANGKAKPADTAQLSMM